MNKDELMDKKTPTEIETIVVEFEEMPDPEIGRLQELEATIDRGISSLHEMGLALIEIQESKLYRQYGTFAEYCRQRWGLSEQRSYQLISHAKVIGNLQQGETKMLPSSESQTRHLAKLPADLQVQVWESVMMETDKPTGAKVKAAATRLMPEANAVPRAKTDSPPPDKQIIREADVTIEAPTPEPSEYPISSAIDAMAAQKLAGDQLIIKREGKLWIVADSPWEKSPVPDALPLDTLLQTLATYYRITPF